jgi:hypothetical protein
LLELIASESQLVPKELRIPISRSTRSMGAYIVLTTIAGSSVTPAMLRNYTNINSETVRLFLRQCEKLHLIRFVDKARKSIRANFSMIKLVSDFTQLIVDCAIPLGYKDSHNDFSWINALTKLHLMDAVPIEDSDFVHLHRSALKRGLAAFLCAPELRAGATEGHILETFPMSREALRLFRSQLLDQGLINVSKTKMGIAICAEPLLIQHMQDMSDTCMGLVSDYQKSGESLEAFGISKGIYPSRSEVARQDVSIYNRPQSWQQAAAKFAQIV